MSCAGQLQWLLMKVKSKCLTFGYTPSCPQSQSWSYDVSVEKRQCGISRCRFAAAAPIQIRKVGRIDSPLLISLPRTQVTCDVRMNMDSGSGIQNLDRLAATRIAWVLACSRGCSNAASEQGSGPWNWRRLSARTAHQRSSRSGMRLFLPSNAYLHWVW